MAFIHLGQPELTFLLAQDAAKPGTMERAARSPIRLAPDWVYPAPSVTLRAVGSYPTISTLPLSRRCIFCDTVRHPVLKRSAPPFKGNPALWCPDFPLSLTDKRMPVLQRSACRLPWRRCLATLIPRSAQTRDRITPCDRALGTKRSRLRRRSTGRLRVPAESAE